ncbi:malectin domain-containing carbohydrate-binding protein [Dyadobacter sandarakinus]|uniref:Choice-of-anchor D domain-containing protein n=1 Tax=Dyadobacter sandarakinus TaxID=2747268 RepID=A0ABX7IBH9_9BACT|nr:malectin domain-containing carbohydrate-binding protein [Dyadobacter sandarakinus]QRR03073.1 choice-of-anchor D domain-containing protein [Dyadobacter sandarakinus]
MVELYFRKAQFVSKQLFRSSLAVLFAVMLGSFAPDVEAAAASPVAEGGYLVLQNMDGFPANDELTFSRIQIPWRRTDPETPFNENHDQVRLKIYNRGYGALRLNGLTLSNPAAWTIVSVGGNTNPSYPINISPGSNREVIIKFIAVDAGTRVKVFKDLLTISSDDALSPSKEVSLMGLWQYEGEGKNEPYAQEIISAFNFTSKTGYNQADNGNEGSTIVEGSSEVLAPHFVRADPNMPVTVYQLAAYHSCCTAVESFRYYAKGSNTLTTLYTHDGKDAQSLSPRERNSTNLAHGTFEPSGAFGIRIGNSYSDRTRNANNLIGLRFLKAIDANGNVIPNAYFVNHDYIDVSFTNYDYQDNMYFITNVRPETGPANYSVLSATTGSAVYFDPAQVGESKTRSVTVQNTGQNYSNGSDPEVQIKSIRIIGPNASDFSVPSSSQTLAPQATHSVDVKFNPKTAGIKNATLVYYYTSSKSPLRVPLYGNANPAGKVIEAVKRIKGGMDTPVTVGGFEFEPDQPYRTGSALKDAQMVQSDVAGTDWDALYQTYLSAQENLAQTGYNIPMADGDYMLRLHFVENYFPSQGSRVFNGVIEGEQVISNLDIFNEVGYRFAIVKDFNVTVSGGALNMNFTPSANRLALAGLEIFKIGSPLPVTLIDFKGTKEGSTASLAWSTSAETNSKSFDIERSGDGKTWNTIGSVAAQGESKVEFAYNFTDANPLAGENLYRLKMIDFDETSAHSKLVSLTFEGGEAVSVYPNPVADHLTIKAADWAKVQHVQLLNAVGRVIYSANAVPAAGIDVKNLPAGMYVVQISQTDGSKVTYKIIKL